jgi:hypothetical protein
MIRTRIDRTAGLVTHTGTGDLSDLEIEVAFRTRFEDPDYRSGMKVLWDCRQASISALSEDGIRRLVATNLKYRDARGSGMSAIVVSHDVDYGVVRVFQAYADQLPWEMMVFRDLEEAVGWLRCGEGEARKEPV